MKKIFWLASYPRSGNTWMRAILSSLFFTKNGKFEEKLLNHIPNFDNPSNYDFIKSLNVEDYNSLHKLPIISKYWSEAQKRLEVDGKFAFYKTHSGNVTLDKKKYTDVKNVLGLIYLIRDPRDVVVSYSKFTNKSIEETIKSITSKICITWSGLPKKNPYPIILSSWEIHYKTWMMLDVPRLVIKYEDLLKNTKKTIEQIMGFFHKNYKLQFENIDLKISNIVSSTDFKKLHDKEKGEGFLEAPYSFSKKGNSELFFRRGVDEQWKDELTKENINIIEKCFEKTMKEFGYLK